MRRRLAGLPRRSEMLLGAARALALPAMVASAGWELREDEPYDWHGLQRRTIEHLGIQVTLAGRGSLTFEGRAMAVEPGTVMVLPMPHDHRYWLPPGGRWEFVFVGLRGREALRAGRMLIDRVGPVLPMRTTSPALAPLLRACRGVLTRTLTSTFAASSLAYETLMALLVEHIDERPGAAAVPSAIAKAKAFASERFGAAIGAADLARVAGYSRGHFTRLFAQSEGLSPGAFIGNLRLQDAMRRLRDGASVGAAARACGYRDAAYFCRAFRKALGVSPGAFRRGGAY